MNGLPPLERRYRRRLACYPRAFRRENEDEILAVLLACAEDGQQRPGLAASADLIRGAVRMRLRLAGRPPRTVRAAARLMGLGAAVKLASLVILITTAGRVRSAVAHRYPGVAVAQHTVNVQLPIDYIGTAVGLAVWLLLIWRLIRGSHRVRIALAVYFTLASLAVVVAIAQGSATLAPADLIAGSVDCLVTLAVTALMFSGAASRYYHPEARPVTPWRGTFGTM
jgi:hypothetical protein